MVDKNIKTFIDPQSLQMTEKDKKNKFVGFLLPERNATLCLDRFAFKKLRDKAEMKFDTFFNYQLW